MSKPKTNPQTENTEPCVDTLAATRLKGLTDLYTSVFLEAYSKTARVEKAQQEAAAACNAMEEYFS